MEKINLAENLKENLTYEQIIKNFLTQVFMDDANHITGSEISEKEKQDMLQRRIERKLGDVVVKERHVDPRISTLCVYAVCSENEINALASFDVDYVSLKKDTKVIEKLKRKKTMKFELYNFTYNEVSNPKIVFHVLKQADGAEYAKNIMVAEDDIFYSREQLDSIGIKF